MKTFYVELGTQSTTVQATNNFSASKIALIEFMPEDSKATEKRFQESDEFPLSLEDLKQDYKDSNMELIVKEINNKFTDEKGFINHVQKHNLQDLNTSDLAFIIDNKINCLLHTSQDISNTLDLNNDLCVGGIEVPYNTPAFIANQDVINQILAVSYTGITDAKSALTTFKVLAMANGANVYYRNAANNIVDCDVRLEF